MVYFLKNTKVHIFLILWATIFSQTKANILQNSDLARFARKLVEPFIDLLNTTDRNYDPTNSPTTTNRTTQDIKATFDTRNLNRANQEPIYDDIPPVAIDRENDEVPMKQFIKFKVEHLKPFLNDDSVIEQDGLRLEGDDETTIIEFVPNIVTKHSKNNRAKEEDNEKKLEFQSKIYKFKKMRNKVKKALRSENITRDTENLVTRTIDKMLAHMKTNKCKWADENKLTSRQGGGKSTPEVLVDRWNDLWNSLKDNFTECVPKRTNPSEAADQEMFLLKFQDLVSVMTKELNHLVGKYKIVCRFSKLEASQKPNLRMDKKHGATGSALKHIKQEGLLHGKHLLCDKIRICSEELIDFMYDFYIHLNNSAVSVVDNYASMFSKDVSDDGYNEKQRIVNMIIECSKVIQRKLDYLFRKETLKLELDPNRNKYSNKQRLYKFIKKTIDNAKKTILTELEVSLINVRYKIIDTIRKDVAVNLNSDMALVEKEFNERMCPNFGVCNGRDFGPKKGKHYVGRRNNIYVNVGDNMHSDEKLKFEKKINNAPKVSVTRTTPKISLLISNTDPKTTNSEEVSSNKTRDKKDEDNVDHNNIYDNAGDDVDSDKTLKFKKIINTAPSKRKTFDITTKSPKANRTGATPKISRPISNTNPKIAHAKEVTSNKTQGKTDKNNVRHKKGNHSGAAKARKSIQRSEIFNALVQQLQNEVEMDLNRNLNIIQENKDTEPSRKEITVKAKGRFKSDSLNMIQESEDTELSKKEITTKGKGNFETESDNEATKELPIKEWRITRRNIKTTKKPNPRIQLENLVKKFKRTREEIVERLDKLDSRRHIILYR